MLNGLLVFATKIIFERILIYAYPIKNNFIQYFNDKMNFSETQKNQNKYFQNKYVKHQNKYF